MYFINVFYCSAVSHLMHHVSWALLRELSEEVNVFNVKIQLVYNHPDLVPAAPVAVRHRKPSQIAAAGLITSKICSVALSFSWTYKSKCYYYYPIHTCTRVVDNLVKWNQTRLSKYFKNKTYEKPRKLGKYCGNMTVGTVFIFILILSYSKHSILFIWGGFFVFTL